VKILTTGIQRRLALAAALVTVLILAGARSWARDGSNPRDLKIVFIDVEGGASTLIVTPLGESVLIDTGWERADGRDAHRIQDAARHAGVRRIDHLITTHWHMDHYGGLGQLAKLMPVDHFYDHGIPDQFPEDTANFPRLIAAYRAAGGGHSQTLKPGDEVPLRQDPNGRLPRISLRCFAANGHVLDEADHTPADGCERHPAKPKDISDNANSLALRLDYGDFSLWTGGDLTWNIEHRLVCPVNRVGAVSLYLTDHHGLNQSNNPAIVQALQPRVAVMNCGAVKGGDIETTKALRSTPSIEAIYQSHRVTRYREEGNTAPELIANSDPDCQGVPIVAEVAPDSRAFSVRVGWGGKPRQFSSRPVSGTAGSGGRGE
jgi:beta-lactamase superfamily II metal-dependent hydrolase